MADGPIGRCLRHGEFSLHTGCLDCYPGRESSLEHRRTCYYAHCVAIYNTLQEMRDCLLLEQLGYRVLNPNHPNVDAAVKERKARGDPDYMEYFRGLVAAGDVFAFRALPDGAIPSGVAKEIGYAQEMMKPIIELPSSILRRTMSLESTREYLREVGER